MAPAHDRFDHVFIAPRDFERAARFYRDGLKWRTDEDLLDAMGF